MEPRKPRTKNAEHSRGQRKAHSLVNREGLPDIRWINSNLRIEQVARALDLKFATPTMIHCWHPDRHQNADRTASVSIYRKMNSIKCFGCNFRPMRPLDLVIDVLGRSLSEALDWITARFEVRRIPKRTHLVDPARLAYRVGFESPIELLVRSGIWSELLPSTRSVAATLVALFPVKLGGVENARVSYRAIQKYSGLSSPNAVRGAIKQLEEIHWLSVQPNDSSRALVRQTSEYVLTPYSDNLMELAEVAFSRRKAEIMAERALRHLVREQRRAALRTEYRPDHSSRT